MRRAPTSWEEGFIGRLPRTDAATKGQLLSAARAVGAAYVTREDCAHRSRGAALTSAETAADARRHRPASGEFRDLARIAREITGRAIEYIPVSAEERKRQFIAAGVPAVFAEIMVSSQPAMAQGTMEPSSSTVKDLTGRAPTGLAEFLAARRDAMRGLGSPSARA